MILITGALGFIGYNFLQNYFAHNDEKIIVIDKFVYKNSIILKRKLERTPKVKLFIDDINNRKLVRQIFSDYKPLTVINFAAETHVDTSISSPRKFIKSNIEGTFNLLENALHFWKSCKNQEKLNFKFLQVSTDEVFGSLSKIEPSFNETSKYYPNNPYSASKASADHFVRAFYKTYGLPTIVSNCSNNYGPFQQSEKLIPNTIKSALLEVKIPLYGDGSNIRDWLHVSDHCEALRIILNKGSIGQSYNIGGNNEISNKTLVEIICSTLDKLAPRKNEKSYTDLITNVEDRLGHDFRYSINSDKLKKNLSWVPRLTIKKGIYDTVRWYIDNQEWLK